MRTICLWAAGVTVFLGLAMALHADDLTKLTVVVKTQAGRPVDRAEVIVRWKANAKHPRLSYGKNVARQFDVRTDQEGQVEVRPSRRGASRSRSLPRDIRRSAKSSRSTTRRKPSRSR